MNKKDFSYEIIEQVEQYSDIITAMLGFSWNVPKELAEDNVKLKEKIEGQLIFFLLKCIKLNILQWQSIESAPKDGSRFLAYEYIPAFENNEGQGFIYVCYWWEGDSLNPSRWQGGFYNQPTRWMPLPEKPKGV